MLAGITEWATGIIERAGYVGLGALVALENVFPPIPSELILPLSGFLAGQGRFNFVGALIAATIGSLIGAWTLYGLGRWMGQKRLCQWVEKHGKWVLVSPKNLNRATDWFNRHGMMAVLIGRCVPGVRSLISVPAGVQRMPIWQFTLYTAIGSGIWNSLLIGLGWWLGDRWETVGKYVGHFEKLMWVGLGGLLIYVFIRKSRKHFQKSQVKGEREA